MKAFIKVLRLTALIGVWLINVDAGDKTEWYVEFYRNDNTIHKCSRDNYNEYKELLQSKPSEKTEKICTFYRINESLNYTEIARSDTLIIKIEPNNYGKLYHLKYKKHTENLIEYLKTLDKN